MSGLLDLVPAPDMCLKIPSGEFSDSAFLWVGADDKNAGWRLIRRTKTLKNLGMHTTPAPTLQEIMEEISSIYKIYSVCPLTRATICTNPHYDPSIHYSPEKHLPWSAKRWRDAIWVEQAETACEAALRTYLSIKNITVTMRCPDCGSWLNEVDNNYCESKTKNDIEEQFIVLSEICPNCKLEFFDTLSCFRDRLSSFTEIITPMGARWIRKEKAR